MPQYVTAQSQQVLTQSHHNNPAQYQVIQTHAAHVQPPPLGMLQPPVQTSYLPQVPQPVVTEQSAQATAVDTTDFDFSDDSDQHQQQQEMNIFTQGAGHPPVVDNPGPA